MWSPSWQSFALFLCDPACAVRVGIRHWHALMAIMIEGFMLGLSHGRSLRSKLPKFAGWRSMWAVICPVLPCGGMLLMAFAIVWEQVLWKACSLVSRVWVGVLTCGPGPCRLAMRAGGISSCRATLGIAVKSRIGNRGSIPWPGMGGPRMALWLSDTDENWQLADLDCNATVAMIKLNLCGTVERLDL